ncbi:MAG: MYG1 family protein [Candidatus Methylacidiphilales bacterium]
MNHQKSPQRIVTHPGSAHKDDLLACAVWLAFHPVPIHRREPEAADLECQETAVIDVGLQHSPINLNFDHHQFPRDHTPQCALSLILQYFALYESARAHCEWLETLEWFDCRGANQTADFLGISREAVARLNSPLDVGMTREFSRHELLQPGDPLWEMMKRIGSGLVEYLTMMSDRMNYLRQHSQWWALDQSQEKWILFIPQDPLPPDDTRSAVRTYLHESSGGRTVVGLIYPDRRGDGYGLSRHEDHPALDLTRIQNEPDVHFAHANGFLAKTSARDTERLTVLLKAALC